MINGRFPYLCRSERGVFTVELALVSSVIVLFLAFISDMVSKQALEGQLQRLSYSAASIIKERTQLYSSGDALDNVQVNQVFQIVRDSMARTRGDFKVSALGMRLEQQKYLSSPGSKKAKAAPLVVYARGAQGCRAKRDLSTFASELDAESSLGTHVTLYQVVLCYRGSNWFGSLVGEDYSTAMAYSITVGR